MRTSRGFLSLLLMGLALLAGCGGCGGGGRVGSGSSLSGRAEGMNVIVIVADTLRADRLSTYGHSRKTSPNLDELAGNGAVFDQAFVQCNFSGGSYASIFSGLYPHNHGVRDHPMVLEESLDTLAEAFRAEGYRTFGRHSHRLLLDRWNYDQGFEDYAMHPAGPASVQDVAQFLRTVGNDPFFLFVQFMEPHFPYRPPDGFRTNFLPTPAGFSERFAARAKSHNHIMFGFEQLGFLPEDFAYLKALYDGEILFTDFMVGKIVEVLEERGQLENTLIVFTSDHGEAMGEHGTVFNHDATLYDEILRVPMVFSNPKLFSGQERIAEIVREIDLFPTLLDLVGAPLPACDGESMLPLLDGKKEGRLAFAESRPLDGSRVRLREQGKKRDGVDPIPHYRMEVAGNEGKWRSVRSASHKLIYTPTSEGQKWELYALETDPGEHDNRFGVAAAGPEEQRLMKELRAWIADDPGGGGAELSDPAALEALRELGYMADPIDEDEEEEEEEGEKE